MRVAGAHYNDRSELRGVSRAPDRNVEVEDDEENECGPCAGQGVDRFGFDCTTCFGTGKIENDE